jgi:hypothetical protein
MTEQVPQERLPEWFVEELLSWRRAIRETPELKRSHEFHKWIACVGQHYMIPQYENHIQELNGPPAPDIELDWTCL